MLPFLSLGAGGLLVGLGLVTLAMSPILPVRDLLGEPLGVDADRRRTLPPRFDGPGGKAVFLRGKFEGERSLLEGDCFDCAHGA